MRLGRPTNWIQRSWMMLILLNIIQLGWIGPGRKNEFWANYLQEMWSASEKVLLILNSNQGLEGYFRDPGFDQNGSRDLGKRTISWREKGFDCYSGSGIHQNLGAGCGILAVCREFGKWYVLAVNAKQLASVQWCVLSKQTINAFKKSTERTEDPLFQPDAKRVHLVLAYH